MTTAEGKAATKNGYTEVEGPEDQIRLLCDCGQVIKKRRDSFLPGTHTCICLACGNTSSTVKLLSGEQVEITAATHRS
jgi:archaellum component FlaF (FlaF/FlaG flagellin family)